MKQPTDVWVEENDQQKMVKKESSLMKNIPTLLRILGAGAVLIATYSFLMKSWESGNDSFRYLMMLGHTGVLAIIGLGCGHWLKESKGARLLLTLALIAIPANFAILGAFIFSQTTLPDVTAYPHYVTWSVDKMSTALLTSVGAQLVLIPVTLLGFTVLARSMSQKLSLLFLVSCASLLIPIRDPQIIGLLVLMLAIGGIILGRKISHNQTTAKTQEGITALALQFLPLAVLVGRSLWLYSADLFLLMVLSVIVFFIMRQISLQLSNESKLRIFLEILSIIPVVLVTFLWANMLENMASFPDEFILPFSSVLAAAMVYDIAIRSTQRADKFRSIAIIGLLIAMPINLMLFANLLAALACISIGLGLIVVGYKAKQRNVLAGGLALMIMGLVYQFYELVLRFDLGSWISLAVLGVIAIVVASTIESQGGKLKVHFDTMKIKFARWDS